MYFCIYKTISEILILQFLGNLEFINNILTNGFVSSLYSDLEDNLEIIKRIKDMNNISTSHEIST